MRHQCSKKVQRSILSYEELGTSGVNLTNYGKNTLEVSSVSWLPIENLKKTQRFKGR